EDGVARRAPGVGGLQVQDPLPDLAGLVVDERLAVRAAVRVVRRERRGVALELAQRGAGRAGIAGDVHCRALGLDRERRRVAPLRLYELRKVRLQLADLGRRVVAGDVDAVAARRGRRGGPQRVRPGQVVVLVGREDEQRVLRGDAGLVQPVEERGERLV